MTDDFKGGVIIIRLEAGELVQTRKLILLR